jgi:spondin-1
MQRCEIMRDQVQEANAVPSPTVHIDTNIPVDCVLSEWTEWTKCSVSCGTGRQEKFRNVVVESQNGGVPCPKRILKRRKCQGPPCTDSS